MNAGRVELDLVAVGKDEVSAMLRTLERNVKAAAGEMEKAGSSAKSFGDKVDGVKQSIAPVNKLKEVFNQVRENALFVVGAVAGVVVGLGKLSDAFSSNASAVKAWGEEQKHVKEYLEKTQDLIENVSRLLGEPQKNELEKASEKVLAVWSQNNTAIETAKAGLAALKDQQLDIGKAIGTWAPEYHRLANEIAKTETMIAELMRDQGQLIEKNTKLLREQARVAGVGFRQDIENAGGQPFFQRWQAAGGGGVGGGGGGGGGGRRRGPDQSAVFQFASPEGQFDLSQTFSDRVLPTADALEAMTFGGRGGNAGSDLVTVRTELDKLTESMSGFAESLAEVSPQAGAIAEGLAAMVAGFSAGGQAAASGAKQTLGALGQIMGGKQGLFIGEGLGEEAAVAASLAVGDLAGAGFHQAAATGYFVAAAAMGKGGSKGGGSRGGSAGGGGGGGGGSRGGNSGPTTVVYNINALVADPHAVRRANAEADRSTRGSGVGMRWGS